jgi:hypothetical protein
MTLRCRLAAFEIALFAVPSTGQPIREYTAFRTESPILLDGRISEPEWEAAAWTERFVRYQNGAATELSTRSKFLWDDGFLYVGFACQDPDVWATLANRDDLLWNEEVVEILCDPDGDGLDYFEVQVNPLGTVLDLFLAKPYSQGGAADLDWNLDSLKTAVRIDGTLNHPVDTDREWTCEVALPFEELKFLAPSLSFPPRPADTWRILVTRYDVERAGDKTVEISSWNQTDSRGFHVPEKFGRLHFSDIAVTAVDAVSAAVRRPSTFGMLENFPNPFNSRTAIWFDIPVLSHVTVQVANVSGIEQARLLDGRLPPGRHCTFWDGFDRNGRPAPSGVYLVVLRTACGMGVRKIVLSR